MKTLITLAALTVATLLFAQDAPTQPVLDESKVIISTGTKEIRAYTRDDYVRDSGKWPLTKSEADEIVAALKDSMAAHYTSLEFYDQAVKSFGSTATPKEREQLMNNLKACAESSKRAIEMFKLWEKRAAGLH